MARDSEESCVSILEGVDALIDSALRLRPEGSDPRYKSRTALIEAIPVTDEGALSLIEKSQNRMQTNWRYALQHCKSQENWRFTKNKCMDPKNTSSETRYERSLVNIPESVWPDAPNWANQVPIASGLNGPDCDGHTCIDLVHKSADREFDFVELKIEADTPLYAAMEIFKYGLVYIFSRQSTCVREYLPVREEESMLSADHIHLMVAAPSLYYTEARKEIKGSRVDWSWIEPSLNSGFSQFLDKTGAEFEIDFQFKTCGYTPFPTKAQLKFGIIPC
jgi:hypothetical protein